MYLGYQEGKIKFYVKEVRNPEFYPTTIWKKTDDEYVLNDDQSEWIKKPDNYEEILAQKKREEKDLFSLTPADVERALYRAKGIDFEDLKQMITEKLPQLDLKALSIEFRAKDFYRGATYNNIRLFDVVGEMLGYTSDDMDYLFENKDLPVKSLDDVIEATEEAGLYDLPAEALDAEADQAEDLNPSAVIKKSENSDTKQSGNQID